MKVSPRAALLVIPLLAAALFAGCSSNFIPAGDQTRIGANVPTPGATSTPNRAGTANPAVTPEATPSASQPAGLKPSNGLVQSSSAGSVDIEVKWVGTQNGRLAFDVSMDTHSVDLDGYDLGKTAVLQDDGGKEYRPVSWDSAPGGHHRSGSLAFSLPDSLVGGGASYLKLTVTEDSGADRIFKWNLR